MAGPSKAPLPPPSLAVAWSTSNKQLNGGRKELHAKCSNREQFSVGGGFGGRVQAVLRDFVDAARGGLNALAVEMIERHAALADGVALFDRFGDVGLGKCGGFEQPPARCQLRGER